MYRTLHGAKSNQVKMLFKISLLIKCLLFISLFNGFQYWTWLCMLEAVGAPRVNHPPTEIAVELNNPGSEKGAHWAPFTLWLQALNERQHPIDGSRPSCPARTP